MNTTALLAPLYALRHVLDPDAILAAEREAKAAIAHYARKPMLQFLCSRCGTWQALTHVHGKVNR